MALHDVDKESENRGTPKPNHTDQLIDGSRENHGTLSANYVSDATPTGSTQFKNAVLTVVGSGSTTITGQSVSSSSVGALQGESSVTIPHGLPFIPGILGYEFSGGVYTPLGTFGSTQTNGNWIGQDVIIAEVDSTNVYIFVQTTLLVLVAGATSFVPSTYQVRYYLFQQTAN